MANGRIGSHPSWGGSLVDNLDSDKQLGSSDSGKVFMVDQTISFTANLPELSLDIAGWNCEFIIKTAAATITYVMAYGVGSAGGSTGDAESVIFKQGSIADVGDATASSKDGVSFVSGAVAADSVKVLTDGTSWYVTAYCEDNEHVVAIDA